VAQEVTDMPPADTAAALERLRIEMRFLRDEVRQLKDSDIERAKSSRTLLVGVVFSFLAPSVGIIWGYAQLTARVDSIMQSGAVEAARFGDHEERIRHLEKVRP